MTEIGRLSGLVASYLLLIQVLLMARVPWLEGIWGQDVLARQHRLVGFTSFHLMLVHIVTITLGYAAAADAGVLHEIWLLVTVYPGMLLATAGTAGTGRRGGHLDPRRPPPDALRVMASDSPVRLSRRRPGLAAPTVDGRRLHRFPGGDRLLVGPVGRRRRLACWSGGSSRRWSASAAPDPGADGGAGIPGRRLDHHVRHGDLDRLGLQAGQFCQWRFLGRPGWTRAHPFTVSAVPTADRLRITVRATGDGTRALTALRPGARVVVEGPYGIMNAARRDHRDVLLIAAGVGVTTMRGLAESVLAEPAAIDAGTRDGFRRPRWCCCTASAARRTRCSHPSSTTSRAPRRTCGSWPGRAPVRGQRLVGRQRAVDPAAELRRLVPDLARREIYLCGPVAWMTQVQRRCGPSASRTVPSTPRSSRGDHTGTRPQFRAQPSAGRSAGRR